MEPLKVMTTVELLRDVMAGTTHKELGTRYCLQIKKKDCQGNDYFTPSTPPTYPVRGFNATLVYERCHNDNSANAATGVAYCCGKLLLISR